jgi:hypothetical protein
MRHTARLAGMTGAVRRLVSTAIFSAAAALVCLPGPNAVAQDRGKTLLESVPWLVTNRGPGQAKGVVYFTRGLSRFTPIVDDFSGAQPFVVGLNEKGWDVIVAKYPYRSSQVRAFDVLSPVGSFLAKRARELREQGYKRVVVGGQSWGAWASLVAERQSGMKADALILLAPATYGARTNPETGQPNRFFSLNRSSYLPLVSGLSTPSVGIFFKGDELDPGGRADFTKTTLDKHNIANLVVNQPAGFSGHSAGWFPLFDFAFGECIATFLDEPRTSACKAPSLDANDFRAILEKGQVPELTQRILQSTSELSGRRFVVYSDDGTAALYSVSSDKSITILRAGGLERAPVTIKDGTFCVGGHCHLMVKWDDHRVISFNVKTGAASEWWTELLNAQ